jgi:hypothetical protein
MTDDLAQDMVDALREQIRAEQKLSERLHEYVGEWVAVRDHEVVAHASSLDKLMESVSGQDVEVLEVTTEDGAVCFF